ncbi:8771_t:CDS:1, partial [Racocetra fulgida]
MIPQIDPKSNPNIRKIITNTLNHSHEEEIFNNIREMPELQKKNMLNLIETMQNPKGKHKNEIISVYLQNKALECITDSRKNLVVLKAENTNLKSVNRKLLRNNQNLLHKIQSVSSSNQHLRNKVEKRISTI